MNAAIKQAILDHAIECHPRECCGLLIAINGSPEYRPCRNMAQGTDHFILCPEDYAKAEADGEIIAVVHSHPDALSEPSQADRVACEASGLPWHIVSYPGKEWAYIEPVGYKAPLIGRTWAHGVLDCYSIIRDWYATERGIELPDFERHDDWWKNGGNIYVENFESAGFYRLVDQPLETGDVLLLQVLSRVPNHGAVYLGNEKILHHLYNRLSCIEVYAGYWRKHSVYHLRYGNKTENHSIR